MPHITPVTTVTLSSQIVSTPVTLRSRRCSHARYPPSLFTPATLVTLVRLVALTSQSRTPRHNHPALATEGSRPATSSHSSKVSLNHRRNCVISLITFIAHSSVTSPITHACHKHMSQTLVPYTLRKHMSQKLVTKTRHKHSSHTLVTYSRHIHSSHTLVTHARHTHSPHKLVTHSSRLPRAAAA